MNDSLDCFALGFFDASFCCFREDLHKVDVMTFCQQKITTGCDLSTQRGRDSSLLWKLLVLLCRQNGVGIPWKGMTILILEMRQVICPLGVLIQLLFLWGRGVPKEDLISIPLCLSLMLPGYLEQILLCDCFLFLGTNNSPMKGTGATSIEEPALVLKRGPFPGSTEIHPIQFIAACWKQVDKVTRGNVVKVLLIVLSPFPSKPVCWWPKLVLGGCAGTRMQM